MSKFFRAERDLTVSLTTTTFPIVVSRSTIGGLRLAGDEKSPPLETTPLAGSLGGPAPDRRVRLDAGASPATHSTRIPELYLFMYPAQLRLFMHSACASSTSRVGTVIA